MQQPPLYPPPSPKQGFFHRTVPVWFFLITIAFVAIIAFVAVIAFIAGRDLPNSTTNIPVSAASKANSSSPGTTRSTSANGSTTHNYQGTGNLKTDPITIEGDIWQMNWTCDPTSFDGLQWNFMVSLYYTDGTAREYYAINEICSSGVTSGKRVEHQGGTFYLDIIAEGKWSLSIQETS